MSALSSGEYTTKLPEVFVNLPNSVVASYKRIRPVSALRLISPATSRVKLPEGTSISLLVPAIKLN